MSDRSQSVMKRQKVQLQRELDVCRRDLAAALSQVQTLREFALEQDGHIVQLQLHRDGWVAKAKRILKSRKQHWAMVELTLRDRLPWEDDKFKPMRELTDAQREAIYDFSMQRSDEILRGKD